VSVTEAQLLLNTARAVLANVPGDGCRVEARQVRDVAQDRVWDLVSSSDEGTVRLLGGVRAHLLAGRLEEATDQVMAAGPSSSFLPALLALLACHWRTQGDAERALSLLDQAMQNELLSNSWRILLGWERWLMRAQMRLRALAASGNAERAAVLARKILRRDQDCAEVREALGLLGAPAGLRQIEVIPPSRLPHPMSVAQAEDGTIYFGSYTLAGTQAALYRLGEQDREPLPLGTGRLYSGLVADPGGTGLVGLCGGEGADMSIRALHRLDFSGQLLEDRDLSAVDSLGQGLPYGLGRTDEGKLVFFDLMRGRLYVASADDLAPRLLCDARLHGRQLYYGVIGNSAYVTFNDRNQLLVVDVETGQTKIVRKPYLKGVCSISRRAGTDGFFMVKRLYAKPGNIALMYDMLLETDSEYAIVSTKRLGCCLSCGVMPVRRAGADCLLSLSYDSGGIVYSQPA